MSQVEILSVNVVQVFISMEREHRVIDRKFRVTGFQGKQCVKAFKVQVISELKRTILSLNENIFIAL